MKCPKCGEHIPTFNLKPNCKNCGVNIMYYTQEYELTRDAKRAELEFASARIEVAKLRAATIGGKLQIARLVLLLLCVAALLIPFSTMVFSLPLFEQKITLSGLGIYQLFSDGMLTSILDFAKSTLFGGSTVGALVLCGILIIIALLLVAALVIEILSFLNIKKTAKSMAVLGFIAAGVSLIGFIYSLTLKAPGAYVSVQKGFGGIVCAALLVIFAVINLKIYRADIPLKVKENDYLRKDMLQKVKSGEVDLDDLTLPVFESEEEKAERLKTLEEALKKEEEGKE